MKKIESLKINKKFITVFSFFAVGFIYLNLLESVSRRIFYLNKNNIEESLGALLNKKIDLGEYSELRFLGFSVNNPEIIDIDSDEVEFNSRSIDFRIMPIRTILNRKWSIYINPNKLRINLLEDSFKDLSIKNSEQIDKPKFNYEIYLNLKKGSSLSIPYSGINAFLNGNLIFN